MINVIPAVSGQLVGLRLGMRRHCGCPWLAPLSSAEPAAAQQQCEGYGIKQQLQQLQDRENRGAEPQAPEAAHG